MKDFSNIQWSPVDYIEAAVVAKLAGEEMLARLEWVTLQPQVIVDVGCGAGEWSARLQARYPAAQIYAVDTAQAMLEQTQLTAPQAITLCAAGETLPLPDQSVDLLFANFLLPWHNDAPALLREWRRVLRPEGLLMATALGLDTLREWREVFPAANIPHLVDMHNVGDALLEVGFIDPVLDVDYHTLCYSDHSRFLAELQASGLLCAPLTTPPSLPTDIEATIETIFIHAFAPTNNNIKATDGSVRIPLSSLRKQLKGKD